MADCGIDQVEERVRAICLGFPGASERLSHGAPAFFAGKRQFVMLWPGGHHDHRFTHLWCAAPPGVQDELVTSEPDRFFRPLYVGSRGWLGVRLDGEVDWEEMSAICDEAFRTVATASLIRALDTPLGLSSVRPGHTSSLRAASTTSPAARNTSS